VVLVFARQLQALGLNEHSHDVILEKQWMTASI
jgi:hypothetical protein